ncbi:hypothetical protein ACHAPJ_007765 [Fusarium lateritium]
MDHELPDLLPEATQGSTQRPFWEEMFPQAMEELKSTGTEPVKLVGTSNSIRAAHGWVEIVNVLKIARARYYGYSGFIGFWKRAGHKATDHANDVKIVLSLLPNTEYSSVIHCVFDVIFDAAKRTAKIREDIETSLRQFREKLEDLESIVAVYTNEDEIVAAALNVLVSILQATEDIVDYYWANKGLEKLKKLQLDQVRLVKEQNRLADAQSQMKEDGRKMTVEQRRLASANTRNAAANEMNAAANMANATISAFALNAFDRLSQEYLTAISVEIDDLL